MAPASDAPEEPPMRSASVRLRVVVVVMNVVVVVVVVGYARGV